MTEYKHLIESKSQVVSLIPGKPYPEDYGTTVEKVREFLEEDGSLRSKKPTLWLQILFGGIGALVLSIVFNAFYHETIITVLFALLGATLGVLSYNFVYRRHQRNLLNDAWANTPEGIFLGALRIWAELKEKEMIATIKSCEKEYKENPWITAERGLLIDYIGDMYDACIEQRPESDPELGELELVCTLITGTVRRVAIWYGTYNLPTSREINESWFKSSVERHGNHVDTRNALYIEASRNNNTSVDFWVWDHTLLRKERVNRLSD